MKVISENLRKAFDIAIWSKLLLLRNAGYGIIVDDRFDDDEFNEE